MDLKENMKDLRGKHNNEAITMEKEEFSEYGIIRDNRNIKYKYVNIANPIIQGMQMGFGFFIVATIVAIVYVFFLFMAGF